MLICNRCDAPPALPRGPLTLRLWSPLGHSHAKLRKAAEAGGLTANDCVETGALRVDVADDRLRETLDRFVAALSTVEREAVRVVAGPSAAVPGVAQAAVAPSLGQFAARWRSAWLIEVLRDDRLEVSFSPIAHADAPDEIHAHEAQVAATGADGRPVAAAELFATAQTADFLAALDRAARIASIRRAAERAVDAPVVIQFSPSAIYDPRFCLRTTVAEAERRGLARHDVVFSILPADVGADIEHLDDILRHYVENGFRTALTISGARNASLEMLQRLKPNLLFIDATLTEGLRTDPSREVVARKMLEIAQRLQIETVVDGVATADDCDWAHSHGASYVQGPYVDAACARAAA